MKWSWFNMSWEKFNFFKVDPNSFLQRFVTMDETWVHHFQPEAVETSRFSASKESQDCDVCSQGDGLHFLGCRSIVGGLPRHVSHCHRGLLCSSFETARRENQPDSAWKADKRSALPPGQCSGTHIHSDHVESNLLKTYPILLIWLSLTKIKKELGGLNFGRGDDVMNAVDHFMKDQNGTFYTEGINLLHDRWTRCVNIGGNCVENWLHLIF